MADNETDEEKPTHALPIRPTPYSLLELFRKGTAALEGIWTEAPADYDRVVTIACATKIAVDHWLTEAERLANGSKEASPIYQAFRAGSTTERISVVSLFQAALDLLERCGDDTAATVIRGCLDAIEGRDPPPLSDDEFRWIRDAPTDPDPASAVDPPEKIYPPLCSSVGCPNIAPPTAGRAGMCPACWEAVEKFAANTPDPDPDPPTTPAPSASCVMRGCDRAADSAAVARGMCLPCWEAAEKT